mgnify:CR=1 FL=1
MAALGGVAAFVSKKIKAANEEFKTTAEKIDALKKKTAIANAAVASMNETYSQTNKVVTTITENDAKLNSLVKGSEEYNKLLLD